MSTRNENSGPTRSRQALGRWRAWTSAKCVHRSEALEYRIERLAAKLEADSPP